MSLADQLLPVEPLELQRPVQMSSGRSLRSLKDKNSAVADIRVLTLVRRLQVAFLTFAHR